MFPLPLLICVYCLLEVNLCLHSPRMVFTDKESAVKRFPLSEQNLPVQILLEAQSDALTSVGKTHLHFYNFNNTAEVPEGEQVLWKDCPSNDCNITVVHQREEGKPLFVCGTNRKKTQCCDMDISGRLLTCNKIENIREFPIKEGEQSTLVETNTSVDLYLTHSGDGDSVGIHKFGSKRVRPANHNKEQYYMGLVVSRRKDPLQSKVYAFYKQKNKDSGLDGDMWLPYVSQVCMADAGGPKNNLQFSWTSLMNARLYCGHPESKQHFSELVDIATVHADQWQDTRVYALFTNEWGMSAVCVYRVGDIDSIFTNSPFIDNNEDKERKKCVSDSTKISSEILRRIEKVSEMKQWVFPVDNSGPVLVKHHSYTRIYVDASPASQHSVLFLSLSNGAIHKALQLESHSFVIAEYQPFNHSAHILNIIFHPLSRKFYVTSEDELVQIDMGNCAQYGNTCQECVMSRDPYCSWKNKRCNSWEIDTFQDVVRGNHSICSKDQEASSLALSAKVRRRDETNKETTVSHRSSYFLRCPVSSHHAKYTWHSPDGTRSCDMMGDQCLLLIDSMTPNQNGEYTCESEEQGYRKVSAKYQLKCSAAALLCISKHLVLVLSLSVIVF